MRQGFLNGQGLPNRILNPVKDPVTAGSLYVVGIKTQYSTTSTSYTKLAEMTIKATGDFRVRFTMVGSNSNDWVPYARIYKNGSPHGFEQVGDTAATLVFEQDLAFTIGDKVQLYVKTTDSNFAATIKDFLIGVASNPGLKYGYVAEV